MQARIDELEDKLFGNISTEISQRDESIKSLEDLLEQVIRVPTAFDEEDQNLIKSQILRLRKERDMMETDLRKRQLAYRNTVVTLENALRTRERILEDFDERTHVLAQNSELMDGLAEKQARLTETLETMKQKLSVPLHSIAI